MVAGSTLCRRGGTELIKKLCVRKWFFGFLGHALKISGEMTLRASSSSLRSLLKLWSEFAASSFFSIRGGSGRLGQRGGKSGVTATRWRGKCLNRRRSFLPSVQIVGESPSFFSDQEIDDAWSPDEASIPAVLHLSPPFGEVSSWPVVGACEELPLSVLSPGLVVSVAACVESRDCIRVSLVPLSHRFRPVLCVWIRLNGCIRSRVWGAGDSNLWYSVPNDGTTCVWTPLRAVGVAISVRFEPPFSLGARGNRGLAPLILVSWGIDATLSLVRTLDLSLST
ncbi:hypothetical protein Bca4012_019449 [Brassica carinata]